MKKIILPIFIFGISSSVLASELSSNQIDLNKPVRWYAKALSNAIFKMIYSDDQSADGAERGNAVSKEFLQTLDIKDGVVSISPAEFIEKCMSVYQAADASTKCSDALIDAVHKHNSLVQTFGDLTNLSIGLSDMNAKIKWDFRVWYNALTAILDLDLDPLVNIFNDYMNTVNNTASLNEWLSECNRAMQFISSSNTPYHKDAVVRMQSHDFSCQKYIETLVQKHNEFKNAYDSEKTINYKEQQNEQK